MTLAVDIAMRRGAFALAARFDAPASGIAAVFGPSGAGKSLLLLALAGLGRIDSGGIRLGERVLHDSAAGVCVPAHLRGVGLVFQDARLLPHLSVRGNLEFAASRAPSGAARLSLAEAAQYFDIAALLDRPTRHLSGGEKSRVALARALLSAPDLLLLDEPFAALDGPRRRAFLDTLRRMHAEFALPMLVVTHQIDEAATLASCLIALKDGQTLAAGPLAELAGAPAFQQLLDARDIGAAVQLAGASAPVWVRADHVLISLSEPAGLSARHVWQAQIESMAGEGPLSTLVRLRAQTGALFSRVTPAAVRELGLAPGASVWAVVKAHAL